MKHWILTALLLGGLSLSAQQGPGHRQQQERLSPAQAAELQSKRMTLALNLDDRQQSQVQSLLEQEMQWRQENRPARRDSTAAPDPGKRFEHMNARMDRQIAMQRNLKEILTAAQFEKWQALRKEHRGKRPRGPHRKEGRRH